MNEPIRLPEPDRLDAEIEYDFDGCITIKPCDPDAVDQIMADFTPVVLTCVPNDAILVQVDTINNQPQDDDDLQYLG